MNEEIPKKSPVDVELPNLCQAINDIKKPPVPRRELKITHR